METKRFISTSATIPVLGALLLISVAVNVYQYRQVAVLKDPARASEVRLRQYIDDIGRVIELPNDEVPTLAIVSDPEELKSQPFFANAQIGDVVLIYTASKKAVLWRPSAKKLIEVSSSVSPSSSGAQTTQRAR